jgi:uncharacterized lipoprotein NlpE involved in copper resistance
MKMTDKMTDDRKDKAELSVFVLECAIALTSVIVLMIVIIAFIMMGCNESISMTYITITDAQTLESMSIVVDSVNDTATSMLLNHTAYMQVNGTEIVNNVYSGVI